MFKWTTILKQSPINWLLEETDPPVRYFTLRDVLCKNEDDAQVLAARSDIPDSPAVKRILQKQNPEGHWEEPTNPYHPKYKSSYWQIMMLGQLGMDKTDERIRKACEHIFQFQTAEGGFSSYSEKRASMEHEWLRGKGKELPSPREYATSTVHEHQYSCLTGNMVAALTRLGYGDDLRVVKALGWLVKIQNKDGGWLCPYWRAHVRD